MPNIRFLKNEFWTLSWNGSVQRSLKYADNTSEKQRSEFKKDITSFIESNIIPMYSKHVSEEVHIENIKKIVSHAKKYNSILKKPYNIGIAQKLLNLFLKYLWCSKLIKEPVHCPVDGTILLKTKLKMVSSGLKCLPQKTIWK